MIFLININGNIEGAMFRSKDPMEYEMEILEAMMTKATDFVGPGKPKEAAEFVMREAAMYLKFKPVNIVNWKVKMI